MGRYAILNEGNEVVNVAAWEESVPWLLPGHIVKIPEGSLCEAGWAWNGEALVAPKLPEPEPESVVDAGEPESIA